MKRYFSAAGLVGLALGLLLTGMAASAATRYVWQDSPGPTPPFTNWATAAHTIQDAVDAAPDGDTVLVTNGVYVSGGRAIVGTMTNRVAIYGPITVQSVMGPEMTLIVGASSPGGTNGDGAIRCAYVAFGAVLSGFTLTNGHTRANPPATDNKELRGGGAYCVGGVLTNCILAGNSASSDGGGSYGGTLYNCILLGNTASDEGGGARSSVLYNCILVGNSAPFHNGGGAHSSTLWNCILSRNSAVNNGGGTYSGSLFNCTLTNNTADDGGAAYLSTLYHCTLVGNRARAGHGGAVRSGTLYNCIAYYNDVGGNHVSCLLNYCCTTPMPTNGVGNITNEPAVLNLAAGDFRLQSNSPCINAGNNAYVSGDTDGDGLPRIAGGTVDIGASEFQTPASIVSYAWLQQYSLPTDGSADYSHSDSDGLNNWQEWRCGTNPTNALSVLCLLPPEPSGADVVVRWQSVPNRIYFLERSTNLAASSSFLILATNLPGQAGTMTFTDTNAAAAPRSFYRVSVNLP